jgi:hypothetical protein
MVGASGAFWSAIDPHTAREVAKTRRAKSFSRLENDASSYLVGRRLDQKVGGLLALEGAMLDPSCRFPAIFEKLGVALMARSFRL